MTTRIEPRPVATNNSVREETVTFYRRLGDKLIPIQLNPKLDICAQIEEIKRKNLQSTPQQWDCDLRIVLRMGPLSNRRSTGMDINLVPSRAGSFPVNE